MLMYQNDSISKKKDEKQVDTILKTFLKLLIFVDIALSYSLHTINFTWFRLPPLL